MFIRSSTAINNCLIDLNTISQISKSGERSSRLQSAAWSVVLAKRFSNNEALEKAKEELENNPNETDFFINLYLKSDDKIKWLYKSEEARDKAFDELCAFLNNNYKLRDFT